MGIVRESASAVVQVVTSGVDWPAVVAAISGGIVGLAGIFVAWRQSNRTIDAEDARAKLAEKRRIYASCLDALTHAFKGAKLRNLVTESEGVDPKDAAKVLEAAVSTELAAGNAVFEVDLVGSPDVVRSAIDCLTFLSDMGPTFSIDEWSHMHSRLVTAMRTDLDTRQLGPPRRSRLPYLGAVRKRPRDPESLGARGDSNLQSSDP
jgi:hypothetical protein